MGVGINIILISLGVVSIDLSTYPMETSERPHDLYEHSPPCTSFLVAAHSSLIANLFSISIWLDTLTTNWEFPIALKFL